MSMHPLMRSALIAVIAAAAAIFKNFFIVIFPFLITADLYCR